MSAETKETKLFGIIPITSDKHFEVIYDTLNKDSALYILVQCASYAHYSGLLSLAESELLSKSIRKVSENDIKQNEDSSDIS